MRDWYILFVPLSVIGIYFVQSIRANAMLDRWAREELFEMVRCERRWFRRGPFEKSLFGHQAVYFLELTDKSGSHKTCFAKLGGFNLGLWSSDIAISWVENAPH